MVSFFSQSTGDIYIKAVVSNITSNNIQLRCVTHYYSLTTDPNIFVLTGEAIVNYNTNGMTVKGIYSRDIFCSLQDVPLNDFEIEMDIVNVEYGSGNCSTTINIQDRAVSFMTNNRYWYYNGRTITNYNYNYSLPLHYKAVITGNTIKIYLNNELKLTDTFTSRLIRLDTNLNRSITIKDLIIQEL